ncbi:hypothetical protein GCM10008922_11070 [Faecalicatena contorta]
MELAGKDEDDITGGNVPGLKVNGYLALSFFNNNKFNFFVPVEWNLYKIKRNGT